MPRRWQAAALGLAFLAPLGAHADGPAPKTKMNLALVLLAAAKLPTGPAIERAFESFAVKGQRLRLRPDKGGKPRPGALELELEPGGTAFVSLMPAPVPNGEADENVRYSVSAMNGRWKLPRHAAHLVVTAQGTPRPLEGLSSFTSLVAAVAQASSAVGVYCGGAGATHDPKFFEEIARERETQSRLVLWTGVSIARAPDGRLSLLSEGMGQLELPDLLLIVPGAKANEALGTLFDLLGYVVTLGKAIPEGDTVGHSAAERLRVHYVPSPADPKVKVWRVEQK